MRTLLFAFLLTISTVVNAQWFVQVPINSGGYNYQINVEIESMTLEKGCNGIWPPFLTDPYAVLNVRYNIWLTGSRKPSSSAFSYFFHHVNITISCNEDWHLNILGNPQTSSTQTENSSINYLNGYNCNSLTMADLGCSEPEISVHVIAPGQSIFGSYPSIAVPPGFPLPIELVAFDAKNNGNVIDLSWTTASEANNNFFSVERSADLENWTEIGRVTGAGNSNITLEYTLQDVQPLNGTSYYRLKQTDFNGVFSVSEIEVVEVFPEGEFVLYPNPAEDVVAIRGVKGAVNSLEIIDHTGNRVLRRTNVRADEKIRLNNFQTGLYRLILWDEKGTLVFSENLYVSR